LVALNADSIALHKKDVRTSGCIILDREKFAYDKESSLYFDIPLHTLAKQAGGSELYVNSVACGFIASLVGIEFKIVISVLKKIFHKKDEEIIKKNIQAAKMGYGFKQGEKNRPRFDLEKRSLPSQLVMDGNQAIALGAIAAGCNAYPMTPSTSILTTVAHYAEQYDIVVEQAEDEIAAINMAIGASFAGVRSMVGTSGGGFALMGEGISLAGITETPVVVVDSQRPGPATGLPTRTEQGDLNFLIHSGHGEFVKAVFSPGTIEEAFFLTIKAFYLAEKYQIPVMILTDQHLADCMHNMHPFAEKSIRTERFIISREQSAGIKDYKRYKVNDSGISPRAVPSWIHDVIYTDSDEHDEQGHITESAQVRNIMMNKRFYKRLQLVKTKIEKPAAYGMEGAQVVILGFRSTHNVCKEACAVFKNKRIGFIHLPQVWPFPDQKLHKLLDNITRVFTVENNAGAQLAGLLRRETGIAVEGSILRYDGRPFNLDYLLAQLEERM